MAKITIQGTNGEQQTLTTDSLTRADRHTIAVELNLAFDVALFEIEATTQDEHDAWGSNPTPRAPGCWPGTVAR